MGKGGVTRGDFALLNAFERRRMKSIIATKGLMVHKQGKDPAEEFLAFAANRAKRVPGPKVDDKDLKRASKQPSMVKDSRSPSVAGAPTKRPSSAVVEKKSIAA